MRTIDCLSVLVLALLAPNQTRADAAVYVSMDGFSPASATIGVGDAVYWMVVDEEGPYTISSLSGDWIPLYLYDEGDSTGLRFNEAGDYSYYDAFNSNFGVIHVRNGPANYPPTGAITSPSDGAVFRAPASFALSVDASDPDDGVMDVEFYVGNDLVDDVFNPPFSTFLSNLSAGQYLLKIVVYDYYGESATRSIVIPVQGNTASAPALASPRFSAGQ